MLRSKFREIQCFIENPLRALCIFFPPYVTTTTFSKKKLALLPKKKTVIKMCSNNQDRGPTEI